MELRTLRYFVTVAEEANITHAAEKLHMSQPPLSHQMQLLEQELGVTLFLRGKRRLQLTEEGTLLLRRARELLDLEEKVRLEIQEMKNGMSGTLYLGMVEGRAPYLAARWITGFQEEYPGVRYQLWNGSTDDVLERVDKGLADLAVIATPYDGERLNALSVGEEPWVAMIPRSHPLAQCPGEEIPLASLKGEPLIVPARPSRVESIRQWFASVGLEPNLLCTTSNYLDAVALSEQGAGISIFPQTTYTPNDMVVSKIITQPRRQVNYVLVWGKTHKLSPLAEEFVHYVEDFLEEDRIHSERFRVKDRSTH